MSRHQTERGDSKRTHRSVLALLALALTAACGELSGPGSQNLQTSELLILGLQAGAPPVQASSFWVPNSRAVTRRLLHTDNTQYLELQFPVGSIVSVNGAAVAATDSVLVTAQPRAGGYGLTLSPASLEFSAAASPRATFSYAVYGDRSVADGSSTYADRDSYSAALDVWTEISADLWTVAAGSSNPGADFVSARVETGGLYLVAAPR